MVFCVVPLFLSFLYRSFSAFLGLGTFSWGRSAAYIRSDGAPKNQFEGKAGKTGGD
ncbi:hypothetical protein B0H17DRAFT_1082666 [Mycena rosella]|uniref:Uncharacterized protein n=1 Tax=Mycena rosella TaxID=1033263 RepID=A0AAD7D151_MYCRO|nr:hypothetical protein B0H17DRAFT_1082666 [Mycena rosella]